MKTTIDALMLCALLALAVQPAQAETKKVFRCEDAAGRVTYSDEACRGGVELKNSDERSERERQAAAQIAAREERLADKLARERRADEKAARPAGPAHIAHSAADKAAAQGAPSAVKPRAKKAKTTKSSHPPKVAAGTQA